MNEPMLYNISEYNIKFGMIANETTIQQNHDDIDLSNNTES